MWEQTKIEEFVDGELEVKVAKSQHPRKSTLDQILDRLEHIEEMLSSGHIARRPIPTGPPVRSSIPSTKRRKPDALASELKDLMGAKEGDIYLGTHKEILAALRDRK